MQRLEPLLLLSAYGELDEDGAANGTIVDPVGLGFNPMVSAAIVRSSLNGSGADLAATGMNRFATYALVAVMLIIGAYGLKKYFVNTSAFGNK